MNQRYETGLSMDRQAPDALSFGGPDWLDIAVNQLHRSPPLHGDIEAGEPPYLTMRAYTGSEGVPGR